MKDKYKVPTSVNKRIKKIERKANKIVSMELEPSGYVEESEDDESEPEMDSDDKMEVAKISKYISLPDETIAARELRKKYGKKHGGKIIYLKRGKEQ